MTSLRPGVAISLAALSLLVGGALLSCSSTVEPSGNADCLERGPPVLSFYTQSQVATGLSVGSQPVSVNGQSSLQVAYGGDSSFELAQVIFFFADGATAYSLNGKIAPVKELLLSRVGQRFSATRPSAISIRTSEQTVCEGAPRLPTEAEVLSAVGSIDFDSHRVDRDYSRTVAIDVDWTPNTCDIAPFRSKQTFTLSAQAVAFGCGGLFQYADAD